MARPKLDAPNYRLTRRGAVYYIRWWQNGCWQRLSTRTEDRGEAARFLAQFAAGGSEPVQALPTIDGMLDAYLIDRKPRVASFATLKYACAALRRHLGDLLPDHLTKEQSRLYARRRRAEGHMAGNPPKKKPTKDGTIIRELVTLRAALRNAGQNDAANRIETPRQPAARERWLSRSEADALLKAAQAPHVRLFLTLALYTGARTTALLNLEWPQVDLVVGLIDLGSGTGNKRRAVVPIPDPLMVELQQARKAATGPRVVEHGGKPVASVKTGVMAACARANLKGVTPHILRHTAATWLVMAGRPTEEIARYLGMSENTVKTVYGKHHPDYLRAAAAALTGPVAPLTRQSGAK